jgi:excisionase family DNA binding protein
MNSDSKRILSVQQVAALLGVHVTTLYRWCAAGTFVPKVRLGPGRVGFALNDVNAWIEKLRAEAAPVTLDRRHAV